MATVGATITAQAGGTMTAGETFAATTPSAETIIATSARAEVSVVMPTHAVPKASAASKAEVTFTAGPIFTATVARIAGSAPVNADPTETPGAMQTEAFVAETTEAMRAEAMAMDTDTEATVMEDAGNI
jgi:hypothetical protein